MNEFKGRLNTDPCSIAIVVSRFNEFITQGLLNGALDSLDRLNISRDKVTIAWVPGACEIPLIAKQLALMKQYDAIICLGAVIRGATAHFDYVCGQVSSGISNLSHEMNLPIIFGVITTDTIEQALERAGTKCGNKGSDSAIAAVEMVDLMRQLKKNLAFQTKLKK